jgi:hypothetical protein
MLLGLRSASIALALLAACADDGASDPAADAGQVVDDGSDEQQLRACELAEPCFESTALMVENRIAHVLLFDCVIRGLAAGTPGRYLHATDAMWSDGSIGARHTLIVAEDGSALYTRVPHATGAASVDASGASAQRCVLRPRSYFEACVGAFEGYVAVPFGTPPSSEAWLCAFGRGDGTAPSELDWFESCEPLSPLACE